MSKPLQHPFRKLCIRIGLPLVAAALTWSCSGQPLVGTAATQTTGRASTPSISSVAVPVWASNHCGVLDQDGKVLLPFDNDFSAIFSNDEGPNLMVNDGEGNWSLVSADGKTFIKKDFTGDLKSLEPGLYGFSRNGKYGIIDAQGTEIVAPRFDDIYPAGRESTPFFVYEINGKTGIVTTKGELVTDAVYDDESILMRHHPNTRGMLVMGKRDGKDWLINLRTGEQKAVPFTELRAMSDGHMVVEDDNNQKGLIDAQGNLKIAPKYYWLGAPSSGLVAFKKSFDDQWGYLDYNGKQVIAPQFASAEPFGKYGALACESRKDDASEDSKERYGVIDRKGKWLVPPIYDYAGGPGWAGIGPISHVPGYTLVTHVESFVIGRHGLFNTDTGKEVIPPKYSALGMLSPNLFVYSAADTPAVEVSLMGTKDAMPGVGVMDAAGKSIIEPGPFVSVHLTPDGRHLQFLDGINKQAKAALYNVQGKQIVRPQWHRIEVNAERGYALAYEVGVNDDGDEAEQLRALYDLNGQLRFVVKDMECGAQQIQDGSGKPIWPADPQPFCKADAQAPKTQ